MSNEKCMICMEPITDPVCETCYLKQIEEWLKDMRIEKIPRDFILEKMKRKFFRETIHEATCVLCGRNNVRVCYHCFFYIASEILRELNFPQEIIERFVEVFNYELVEHDDAFLQEQRRELEMMRDLRNMNESDMEEELERR